MKGESTLCSVIWFKYRPILEAELDFPEMDYGYWRDRFLKNNI